jgi:hypothetical protein
MGAINPIWAAGVNFNWQNYGLMATVSDGGVPIFRELKPKAWKEFRARVANTPFRVFSLKKPPTPQANAAAIFLGS